MRRRRRGNVVWLPNTPTTRENIDTAVNWKRGTLACDGGGNTAVAIELLVRDENPADTENALADYTQGGYILKRVVGKLFVAARQEDPTEGNAVIPGVLVTASLEVLRTDPNTNNPTGLADLTVYDAQAAGNERDPWIWQRSWILSNGNAVNFNEAADKSWGFFPYSNAEYGSVLDGPHVDAKAKRRIGTEERLALIVSATSIEEHAQGFDDQYVDFIFQYRVLGTPTRSSNRRNTSR